MSSMIERVEHVEERIRKACARVGRAREDVTLVAVSKTQPPERVREAADAGIRVFGENKVQEAAAKIAMSPGGLEWHLVGHLQKNKVRRSVDLFSMIHSIDSIELLEVVDRCCEEAGRRIQVLIEVNISGEVSKFGLRPKDLLPLLQRASGLFHVDVTGLMTMPPWAEDVEKARPVFAKLRELRERARDEWGYPLEHLSMGMSHDFEVAIEEGATIIRVGTALFGERNIP